MNNTNEDIESLLKEIIKTINENGYSAYVIPDIVYNISQKYGFNLEDLDMQYSKERE